MNGKATEFIVTAPGFDAKTGVARFHYRLGEHEFCETLTFPDHYEIGAASSRLFQDLLNLSAAVLGLSYFKLRAPKVIRLEGFCLTPLQHRLLLDLYENGLGEFYARNGLQRFGQLEIIFHKAPDPGPVPAPAQARAPRNLLLIGGGKDSLASASLLQEAGAPFTPFAVNPKGPILSSIKVLDIPPLFVRRALDPKMLKLNTRPGYYNGHVPSTAINTMIGALSGLLFNYQRIVLSNERSASEANLVHDGRPVNHQHSKSFAHETLIRQTLLQTTNGAINCFSLLRPFSELKIAGIFARTNRFDTSFSSCNTNFKQGENQNVLWCANCPKCLFVYLMLAPFMSPQRLNAIVGADLLDQPEQLAGFSRLTGLKDHKPWECVGETLEAASTLFALSRTPPWQSHHVIKKLAPQLATFYGEKKLIAGWAELMKDSQKNYVPQNLLSRLPLSEINPC